ncbi:MAG: substrate-binding domain-containing protein [Arachnia sp.]
MGELEGASDPRMSVTIDQRFAGIDDALRAAGISPARVVLPRWNPSIGYDEGLRLLREHPDLTGMIASNDGVAMGIYQAARDLGRRIPEDLSVVSFDNEEQAEYLRPGLTTAHLPYTEMAEIAMEMVLGIRDLAHEVVPMPLVIRDSVRRLR